MIHSTYRTHKGGRDGALSTPLRRVEEPDREDETAPDVSGPRLRRGVVFTFSLVATCGALGCALRGRGRRRRARRARRAAARRHRRRGGGGRRGGRAGGDDQPPSTDDLLSNPTDNCLLYKIAWPVEDATADMQKATAFACEHVASPDTMCGTLSRCDVALPYAQSECNFQLHWVEAPDVHDAHKNTTWWENYFKALNGDMSKWNAYMHNGLQLYVPNVGAIGSAMAAQGIAFMTRTSGDNDDFKHIIYEVSGRIIELIGENDFTTAAQPFDASECPYAHELSGLTKRDMHLAWNASGAGVRSNGLQLPMLFRTTVTAAEPDSAAQAIYEELGSETDSFLKDNYVSDECDVYTVGFAQAKFVEMMYVNNKLAPTGDIGVRDYEDYVQDSHNRFVGTASVSTNQNKWDHWMDQHIGFYATYLSDTTRPVRDDDDVQKVRARRRARPLYLDLPNHSAPSARGGSRSSPLPSSAISTPWAGRWRTAPTPTARPPTRARTTCTSACRTRR